MCTGLWNGSMAFWRSLANKIDPASGALDNSVTLADLATPKVEITADLTDDDLKTEKPKFKRLYGEQNGIRNYQRVFGTDQQRRAIERQDTAMSKLWETPIANNAL